MMRQVSTAIVLTCFVTSTAFAAASTAGSVAAGVGTSASSKTISGDSKVVQKARDDAASFVASGGQIRGAQLEAALRLLRERHAEAQRASDMELAQAILAL